MSATPPLGDDPPHPSTPPPGGHWEWVVRLLHQITVQNVLTIALLLSVAVPGYFSWRFMTDAAFRHEFMNTAILYNAKVPCLVTLGNLQGNGDQHTIFSTYKVDVQLEFMIAIRTHGMVADSEIATLCNKAHDEADLMIKTIAEQGRPK